MYNLLKKTKDITVAGDIWSKMPNISIDYAILEKSKRVVAVPATSIGWSDLGSWEALAQILKKDKDGNTFRGDVISAACRNTFVWPDKKLIAVAGLEDVVIVDTPDALLVCRKDRSQKVKDVVGTLNKRNRGEV